MKKPIIVGVITVWFLTVSTFAFGQAKTPASANNHPNQSRPASNSQSNDTRSRVLAGSASSVSSPKTTPTIQPVIGNAVATNNTERPRFVAATQPAGSSVVPAIVASAPGAAAPNASHTQTYRVGVGDILDIQIKDSMSERSTLYTVMEGGLLDYPLATGTLSVSGLTTDAIAERLRASIKVLNNPPVTVKVRDFASHTVNVIGFVRLPGSKVLRREAVPMYVIISESMPLTEATTATVLRENKTAFAVSLKDSNAMNQLVVAGDVIRVSGDIAVVVNTPEYFFAGGEVNAPGQKAFHQGLTLTQAIIASGGKSLNAGNVVRVSRQNADGRLVNSEYNLQNIQNGKITDPLVQKGDRIEVSRN